MFNSNTISNLYFPDETRISLVYQKLPCSAIAISTIELETIAERSILERTREPELNKILSQRNSNIIRSQCEFNTSV